MATVFLQRPPEVLPVLGAALPQSPGDFTMVFFPLELGPFIPGNTLGSLAPLSRNSIC